MALAEPENKNASIPRDESFPWYHPI